MVIEKFKLETPVLFLIFNRLETTKKILEEIKKAKPKQLFIAADGPRNIDEKKKTDAIRKYVLKNVDWRCDVKTLFREKNLGCKYAVSSAITWYFENVEEGIILEDDCLPSQSFFRFCQEMLEKYKDNQKVMHVSGTNIEGTSKIKEDYFFSDTFNVWGWATWRRAWKNYDVEMKSWKKSWLKALSRRKTGIINMLRYLRINWLTYKGGIDTWDYQWDFSCLINDGVSIVPKKNLISNIGVGGGTHNTNYNDSKKIISNELTFPIKDGGKFYEGYLRKYFSFFRRKIKWF